MKILDVLSEECIVPQIRAGRKPGVLRELAGHLARRQEGLNEAEIVRALSERERIGSTAVGEGLAIPHAKLDAVRTLVACLGRSRKGIEFGAGNGQPTRFFFAILAPAEAAGRHLKVLARITQMFQDADFRARLLAAETAEEMHRIIAAEDPG